MVKIAIIGAGLMGHGFAIIFSRGGYDVAITDPVPEALAAVNGRIEGTLTSLGQSTDCMTRIHAVASLEDTVKDAYLVLEAAPERLELKQDLFARIEAAAPKEAILASNTSVIPITQVMARVKHKSRTLGMHWYNPPHLVPLVEVIQTEATDARHITAMMEMLAKLGKVPVHVKKDVPGFVGNRLQHAMWREAISLIEKGVCDADTIDIVVKNSFGRRLAVLGPMENADLIGTDLTLDIQNQVLAALEDSHEPTAYLKKLVADGKLGFKTNAGFKTWTEEKKTKLRAQVNQHLMHLSEILEED